MKTTKARILVAAVLVVLIGLGAGGYWWFAKRLPDGVALRVGGVSVTDQQLDEQIQTLSALYGVQPPPATDQPRLDKFRRDVAKSTAVAMAIDNVATERKIGVADRQVSDFLAKYVASQYGEGQAGRDAYVKDLADKSTSEPKVLAELKRQITLKQLFDQITSDITVTDEDVRQTFDQRKAEFATPERREIHNIVVKTKEEADALAGELKAGGNLEALAPRRSIDGSTKDTGGNLGLVAAAELQKSYADAAFAVPIGGIFGPVETVRNSGPMFNVGKVVRSQPGAPADFDKIKDGVRRLVISERAEAKWRTFMEKTIKSADVDYAEAYRPADPDALPPPPNSGPGASGPDGQPAP
ncbi:MAG: peptidyl-prolyl cis-trans isomerase, partial [Pseudonocardiales bacterium]|nr:peptidyl-prolyl cis-trans isomerase [Pseudonocardiales bacterium]